MRKQKKLKKELLILTLILIISFYNIEIISEKNAGYTNDCIKKKKDSVNFALLKRDYDSCIRLMDKEDSLKRIKKLKKMEFLNKKKNYGR